MGATGTAGVTVGDACSCGFWAAGPGEPKTFRSGAITSNKAALVIRARKNILRMVSSIQFADGPIGVLTHRGVKIWGLAKFFQMRFGFAVVPFHKLINHSHLHQRRLLF